MPRPDWTRISQLIATCDRIIAEGRSTATVTVPIYKAMARGREYAIAMASGGVLKAENTRRAVFLCDVHKLRENLIIAQCEH